MRIYTKRDASLPKLPAKAIQLHCLPTVIWLLP